jgi:hypothetical protein
VVSQDDSAEVVELQRFRSEVKPALLTRSEITFLRGLVNSNLAKAMGHNILRKLKTFSTSNYPSSKKPQNDGQTSSTP